LHGKSKISEDEESKTYPKTIDRDERKRLTREARENKKKPEGLA
jgi:hypothetical protein